MFSDIIFACLHNWRWHCSTTQVIVQSCMPQVLQGLLAKHAACLCTYRQLADYLQPQYCATNWFALAVFATTDPLLMPPLLPQLQEIAPEYYLTLKHHASWCYVIWAFLTDSEVCILSCCHCLTAE